MRRAPAYRIPQFEVMRQLRSRAKKQEKQIARQDNRLVNAIGRRFLLIALPIAIIAAVVTAISLSGCTIQKLVMIEGNGPDGGCISVVQKFSLGTFDFDLYRPDAG